MLVDDEGEIRITDFGLSILQNNDGSLWNTSSSTATGTVRWMAPEILSGLVMKVTSPGDVWSWAVTCWVRNVPDSPGAILMCIQQLFSGTYPYSERKTDASVAQAVISTRETLPRIDSIPDSLWSILLRCWSRDPAERPSTEEVTTMLENSAARRVSQAVSSSAYIAELEDEDEEENTHTTE